MRGRRDGCSRVVAASQRIGARAAVHVVLLRRVGHAHHPGVDEPVGGVGVQLDAGGCTLCRLCGHGQSPLVIGVRRRVVAGGLNRRWLLEEFG